MVVDFDYANNSKKYICNFKWEPASVEWNPHHANDDLFASVVSIIVIICFKIISNYVSSLLCMLALEITHIF